MKKTSKLRRNAIASFKKKLVVNIVSESRRKEISQGELARLAVAERSHVNRVLRGSSTASLDLLLELARCVGLHVSLKIA